jgi:chromosome segregation ATPase
VLEQVKSELSLNDLESFKNVVNSTNETHNKLIASIQKNLDSLLKERPKAEAALTGLEGRVAEVMTRTASTETALAEAVRREQAEAGKIEERVRNMQASVREMQERLSEKRKEEDGIGGLKEAVEEAKVSFNQRMQETADKLTEIERHVGEFPLSPIVDFLKWTVFRYFRP